MSNSVHNRLRHSATHRGRYADLAVPQSPVCGTPESTGFGTLAAKESHLMVQQADEHRAEDEGEHPIHERKHRGNFNGVSGKREGNHPDRGDQREHEQDRKKNESKDNQQRLEVSKNRATSHAETSIPPSGQIPSDSGPRCRVALRRRTAPLNRGKKKERGQGPAAPAHAGNTGTDELVGSSVMLRL